MAWWINNTGFLTGPQGTFSIDACSTERRTRAYLAAIRRVTPRPVRTVVNTHHHGGHTFGNALFPGATIVAHECARAEALAFGPARELPFWENPDCGELPLEPRLVLDLAARGRGAAAAGGAGDRPRPVRRVA